MILSSKLFSPSSMHRGLTFRGSAVRFQRTEPAAIDAGSIPFISTTMRELCANQEHASVKFEITRWADASYWLASHLVGTHRSDRLMRA